MQLNLKKPKDLGTINGIVADQVQLDPVNNTGRVTFRVFNGMTVKGQGQTSVTLSPATLDALRRDLLTAICSDQKLDPADVELV